MRHTKIEKEWHIKLKAFVFHLNLMIEFVLRVCVFFFIWFARFDGDFCVFRWFGTKIYLIFECFGLLSRLFYIVQMIRVVAVSAADQHIKRFCERTRHRFTCTWNNGSVAVCGFFCRIAFLMCRFDFRIYELPIFFRFDLYRPAYFAHKMHSPSWEKT